MNQHSTLRSTLPWLCCLGLFFLLGCGNRSAVTLVNVTGTITMDGEPLQDVEVVFRPLEGGRLSSGRTNEFGEYRLEYLPGQPGAIVGSHQVLVSSFVEADSDSSDPVKAEGRKESIPSAYNSKSTLETEVTPGSSYVINFDLESSEYVSQTP